MVSKQILLVSVLFLLIFCTGCTQNTQTSPAPASEPVPVVTHVPAESNNTTSSSEVTRNSTPEPSPLIIQPTSMVTSTPANTSRIVQPTRMPDPTSAFRDRITLSLDDMQAAKEGIILSYQTGDIERVREKSKDFANITRKNSIITDMPSKMDYARMNYYEYLDQAGQFAQSFSEGANRWMAGDKASANSLFDAGIMASDRADIAEKRIRKFFTDHLQPYQT